MSTRGLLCVALESKLRLAQYITEDAYPSQAGVLLLAFLGKRPLQTLGLLCERLQATMPCTQKDFRMRMRACGFSNPEKADREQLHAFEAKWAHLTAAPGVKILDLLLHGTVDVVKLEPEFARDSLYCEWVYVLDADTQILEIYKGKNTQPVPRGERFHRAGLRPTESGHYPVRLLKAYPLTALPTASQLCAGVPE